MSDYGDLVRKHRRLAILRHLERCSNYSSNASILVDVLHGVGVTSSRDQVITEIAWLTENGLATYEGTEDFIVVTASRRGVEIARGQVTHPDVQRPAPRG